MKTQKNPNLREFIESFHLNPCYTPNRYETTDGIQDSKLSNRNRAELAKLVLPTYGTTYEIESESETEISDLICNLLHLTHSHGYNPVNILKRAITHFNAEAGNLREMET